MRRKNQNSHDYMVDVFYQEKEKVPETKSVKLLSIIFKVVLILAVIVIGITILPPRLIQPSKTAMGDSVLIRSALNAQPVPEDNSIPDNEIWQENVNPVSIDERIYLAWDDFPKPLTELPPNINVLAPCWFKLEFSEDKTSIDYIASDVSTDAYNYVEFCHNGGVEVWGTIQNFDPDLSAFIVTDEVQRQIFIDQVLLWITSYSLDGINIDFEKMNPEHKQLFNEFCQQLNDAMPENMPLSACVTVKLVSKNAESNWWQAYDREGLAKAVDYVAVMSYDDHKSSSKKPVASIGWVDLHIRRLLEEIPSNKLIMGMPFYGTDYRAEVVDAQTLSVNPLWSSSGVMTTVYELNKLLEFGQYADRYGAGSDTMVILDYWIDKGSWNAEFGISNYSFVDTSGLQHTIWIDDENSIYQKTRLAEDYNLAGVGIWKKSLGTESMFEAVARAMN